MKPEVNVKMLKDVRWMKSRPALLQIDPDNIDLENGILRDVVMVQEGPAKGHGVNLEREFIENITRYDQKYFSKTGLKGRFGHPNASSETMGTQMGVFSNFRTREKDGILQEIADMKVLDSAEYSPTHPKMKSWVLSMAKERPDFIMSSIVFVGSGYYQRKESGRKERLKLTYDDYGDPVWINYDPELPVYVEFDEKNGAEHYYTDLVEAGAATDSLFSNRVNPHLYVSQADQFLEDHPHIKSFMQQHPDKVQAFLATVGVNISTTMSQESTPTPKTALQRFLAAFTSDDEKDLRKELTELQSAKDKAESDLKSLSEKYTALEKEVAELKAAAKTAETELAARAARITELEAAAADVHTGGQGSNGSDNKETYSEEQKESIRKKLRNR